MIDQHKSHINKCIDVVKKLLNEKSTIEKKEARQRCMQNRLRLGQFVTQRVGATFQENWTDGYAFHELTRLVFRTLYFVLANYAVTLLRSPAMKSYLFWYIVIQMYQIFEDLCCISVENMNLKTSNLNERG